jgi:hypothetical protein
MAESHLILGIHVPSFAKNSGEIQKVFTEYGCNIRTRLGLHDVANEVCQSHGLILVEFIGGEALADEMIGKIKQANPDVEIKKMAFGKP